MARKKNKKKAGAGEAAPAGSDLEDPVPDASQSVPEKAANDAEGRGSKSPSPTPDLTDLPKPPSPAVPNASPQQPLSSPPPPQDQPILPPTPPKATSPQSTAQELDAGTAGVEEQKGGSQAVVQEEPINIEDAKDAVGEKLQKRPSVQGLLDSHVIQQGELGQEAPAISNAKGKLERQLLKDHLKEQLAGQPAAEELKHAGILKDCGTVAPSLQALQQALSMNMSKDAVEQMLERRPSMDALKDSGLVPDVPVADSILRVATDLERRISRDSLKHSLQNRLSLEELSQQGIYRGAVVAGDGTARNQRRLEREVAPCLQPAMVDLERNMRKGLVTRMLRRRPSSQEMDDLGWFTADLAEAAKALDAEGGEVDRLTVQPLDARGRYALALKATAHLAAVGRVDPRGRGRLKDLILHDHPAIGRAVEAFERSGDLDRFLETFTSIAKRPSHQ